MCIFSFFAGSMEVIPSSPWEQIFSCQSPNPDVYYTAIEILPISNPSRSLLLFLAGTDCQLYVDSFSLASPALQHLCVLSVSLFRAFHRRDRRTGSLPSACTAPSPKPGAFHPGICCRPVRTVAAESGNCSAGLRRFRGRINASLWPTSRSR